MADYQARREDVTPPPRDLLAELRVKLREWERNIRAHHEQYLLDMDSIGAMGSRAQLDLLDVIYEVIGGRDLREDCARPTHNYCNHDE